MLERVIISSSRDIPNPGNTLASHALAGKFFTAEPPRKPLCQIGTIKSPISPLGRLRHREAK